METNGDNKVSPDQEDKDKEAEYIFSFLDTGMASLVESRNSPDYSRMVAAGLLFAKTLAISRVHDENNPNNLLNEAFVQGDQGATGYLEAAIVALRTSYANFVGLVRDQTRG